ncbi:hypothetical protein COCSUDRAFT_52577 [Coccomyxa subellipsoidea C-169]|uniref:Cohesin domain-containing protein n=1 Tax=Coccomyxa subellipsoidea (strain C-169) TaxID=574566 RepID=I0Z576_COCSC|nr:hypothetical protein COCSUDRAFT_52577 [Coccomyxa subellipsoidea C-169]EIE25795.1 hypothetical protein COCSUDRAFT_52577 [Coccomyxa subellipsoidea C-169]|eukprot:XP_005650339.1 hypothetical protein COCSUDRAFT_52577 [Coccomyxa subellipsoidea C-169]
MLRSRTTGLWVVAVAIQGMMLMASAQQPRAGAVYIIEAANATFLDANTLVLNGASGSTAFKVDYPYSDAGVMDTGMLLQDPVYSPQGVWLGSPMGTIFGTAANGNATAVILLINAVPVFDAAAGTLTFNITIVSDPKYIKFPDGIARLTYAKAVTPSAYARPLVVTAQVSNSALLTSVALFLDVDQTTINPASAPTGITNNNNNGGGFTNNNNNGGGGITNNNGGGFTNNNNNSGYTNNNNNGGGSTITNNNGAGFTNNNNNGGAAITNNGVSSGVPGTITNNNNNGGSSVVPAAPGQTPVPGTYNVVTTTTDCNGHVDVQYSYVPGLRGISRNNNNNCG